MNSSRRSIFAGFQRQQRGRAIAEVVVAHLVEIEAAAVDGQVLAPIVVPAPVAHEGALLEVTDLVGAGAERGLQCGLLELARGVVGLGEDRQPRHPRRQVAVRRHGEGEANRVGIDGLRLDDILEQREAVRGMALLLEDVEAEDHVGRGHWRAIGEPGFGAHAEGDGAAVRGKLRRVRDEAVDGVRLVHVARHQGVEQQVKALGGITLQDEVVEAVEGIARRGADERQAPALGGVGVDPVEVLEVRGNLEIAEGREAMPRPVGGGLRWSQAEQQDRGDCGRPGAVRVQHRRVPRVLRGHPLPSRVGELPGRCLVEPPGLHGARRHRPVVDKGYGPWGVTLDCIGQHTAALRGPGVEALVRTGSVLGFGDRPEGMALCDVQRARNRGRGTQARAEIRPPPSTRSGPLCLIFPHGRYGGAAPLDARSCRKYGGMPAGRQINPRSSLPTASRQALPGRL